jgi:hypothetical protein
MSHLTTNHGGHWFRSGFWRREWLALNDTLGLGRFRAPWKLTGRELVVHAAFFVLNYALIAVVPLVLYYAVSRFNRTAADWIGSLAIWTLIICAFSGRGPRLRIRR